MLANTGCPTSGNDALISAGQATLWVPTATPVSYPSVSSITRTDPNFTSVGSVDFTLTFSESVTGVFKGALFFDFALAATGITGASITNVSGSGDTYTVTVNTIRKPWVGGTSIITDANIVKGNKTHSRHHVFVSAYPYCFLGTNLRLFRHKKVDGRSQT